MADVLIIEDEAVLARSIARFLTKFGHAVTVVQTLKEGEKVFGEQRPDLALLDVQLPDGNGLDLLERLMVRDPHARILLMTAHSDPGNVERALELGACACLQKPMDLEDLASTVTALLADAKIESRGPAQDS